MTAVSRQVSAAAERALPLNHARSLSQVQGRTSAPSPSQPHAASRPSPVAAAVESSTDGATDDSHSSATDSLPAALRPSSARIPMPVTLPMAIVSSARRRTSSMPVHPRLLAASHSSLSSSPTALSLLQQKHGTPPTPYDALYVSDEDAEPGSGEQTLSSPQLAPPHGMQFDSDARSVASTDADASLLLHSSPSPLCSPVTVTLADAHEVQSVPPPQQTLADAITPTSTPPSAGALSSGPQDNAPALGDGAMDGAAIAPIIPPGRARSGSRRISGGRDPLVLAPPVKPQSTPPVPPSPLALAVHDRTVLGEGEAAADAV